MLAVLDPWSAGFTGLAPEWEQVIGRFHPPLVHMPIGLLLAAGLFALIGGVSGRLAPAARACLGLGLLCSFAAAASGWLFALHDEGNDPALDDHRWAGLAVVGLALLAWGLGVRAKPESGRASLARWLTVVLAGLVAYAGHEGGELVWGDDFQTAPLERADSTASTDHAATTAATPGASSGSSPTLADAAGSLAAANGIDFKTQIEPIFAASCYQCHGPDRARGRLRLDAREFVFEAQNPVVIAGDPSGSELLRRVLLPESDRKSMPAKGDPLSPEQTQLLERWIESGAAWPEDA